MRKTTRKVTIRVENLDSGLERFRKTWKTGQAQGEFITFDSVETLFKTLSGKRWELVSVLQRSGPMSLRALARELGRDVKNVHTDVRALKEVGLVEDHAKGGVWVPYTEIEARFIFRSAA